MVPGRWNRWMWRVAMPLAGLLLICMTASLSGQVEEISVTLWIHSGRPNPQWEIQPGAVFDRLIELVQALDASTEPQFDYEEWNRMGYASFLVDLRSSRVSAGAVHVWREMAVLFDAGGRIIGYALAADGLYDALVAQAEERSLSAFFYDYADYQARRFPDYQIAEGIYESLVDLDPEANVVGELATSWEVSDDGFSVIFHLREGVLMHDGTRIDADTVVYNFENDVELLPGFIRAPLLSAPTVEAVEVVDELTVRVRLNRPTDQQFWFGLSGWTGMIAARGCTGVAPTGSGPYRLDEPPADGILVLRACADYWAGPPQVGQIIYRAIPDQRVRFLEFESGNLDAVMGIGLTSFDQVCRAGAIICGTSERFIAADEGIRGLECYPDGVLRFNDVESRDSVVVGLPSLGG